MDHHVTASYYPLGISSQLHAFPMVVPYGFVLLPYVQSNLYNLPLNPSHAALIRAVT